MTGNVMNDPPQLSKPRRTKSILKYDLKNEQPNEDSFYQSCQDLHSNYGGSRKNSNLDELSNDQMGGNAGEASQAAQRLRQLKADKMREHTTGCDAACMDQKCILF